MRQMDVAERTGIDFTPEMQEQFVRENTNGKFGVQDAFDLISGVDTGINPRNIGRSLVQGATFNFGDELLGLISPNAKEEMRLREEMYGQEHPYAKMAGEMVGGFAVPGMGAAKAAKGAVGVGSAIARGAAIGAGAGALAGVGAGESAGERVSGAVTGGVTGGALGATLPAVLGTTRLAVSPTARFQRKLAEKIDDAGGVSKLREKLGEFNAAGKRDEVIFGDLTPDTQELLRFVANNDEKAFVKLKTLTAGRQGTMADRMLRDFKRIAGNPHASTELRAMKKSLDEWARGPEGFEGLRQQNPQLEDLGALGKLQEYLKQPRVRELWKTAREERLIGEDPDLGSPSYEQLHGLRMKLDRAVSKAFATPGEGNLARGLKEVFEQVDGAMDQMVPEHLARNAIYRAGKAEQKALALGVKWATRADNQELMSMVARMAPGELSAFRKGFVSQLLIRLRSTKTNRNLANELLTDRALQERMQIVFGDQDVFNKLMGTIGAEGQMAASNAATGGSQTHRLGMGMDYDPMSMAGDALQGLLYGPQAAATAIASRRLPNLIARRTARAGLPTMLTQGTPAIDALLAKLQQKAPQAVPPWMQGRLPVAGAVGAQEMGQQY